MTVSTGQSSVTIQGNGATATFTFPFIWVSASYIKVVYTDVNGNQTLLSPNNYILSLNPAAPGSLWGVGGSVTYPISGSPIPNNTLLTISRELPLTQLTAISNQGSFYPTVTEQAIDTQCMEVQQVAARTGAQRGVWQTGVQYNTGDIVQDGVNGNNTGNYYSCVIANLSNVWSSDLALGYWSLSFNVQQVQTYSVNAAGSAAAALVSQNAAAASATSAGNSATAATTEAGIATTQAGIATTQAGIATTQATTATTQAGTATTQATTAATQAGIATTEAGIATTQAGIATTQAGIATTQASNASASAVIAASTLTGTSTTSNTIGTGTLTFTTQTNKQFQSGQYVIIANGGNYVSGPITTYTPSTGVLVMSSTKTLGSGTFSAWTISVSGVPGSDGAGSGSVTSVSVTTANGVSATVANPTTTPALSFTLGAITPTTVNGLTISTSTGTLTVANGKTLTNNNTLTFTGTDASSIAFGTGGTVAYTANNLSVFAATTSAQLAGIISDETGSGSLVFATSPTLVTPALGTPSAAVLTNATGLPLSSGVTGTLPPANGGTGQTTYTNGQLLIGNSTGNTLTKATLTAGTGITITNSAGGITIANSGTSSQPTYQYLTASGTYTTPANCKKIHIEMVGGGGGGGGYSASGGTGGDTIFNAIHAAGGLGGVSSGTGGAPGGAGGSAGTGSATFRFAGNAGGSGSYTSSSNFATGSGASSFFGGGGAGVSTAGNGSAGATNTGGGGGGGSLTAGGGIGAFSGGGSGEYVILDITTPASTYSFTIGAGGSGGGTSGSRGGAGGSGFIQVTEFY